MEQTHEACRADPGNCPDPLTCDAHGSLAEAVLNDQERREAQEVEREAERIAYEAEIAKLEAEIRDAEERKLTSWAPVDLGAVLDGDITAPKPTILARRDGACLIYPGRSHSFVGESEGGKTIAAYFACSQELTGGRGVVYVDFEGEAADFARWMVQLGVPGAAIRERARYMRPEDPIDSAGKAAIIRACNEVQPSLVVFDGVTEAMMLHGLNDKEGTDTARFMKEFPKRFERLGVAALLIDHVPHGGDRATGSQHKRSSVTGASYLFVRRGVLVEGKHGKVDVSILKDRPSQVRKKSASGKKVGTMHVSSAPDSPGRAEVYIEQPATLELRPVGAMERVSRYVEANPGTSRRSVGRDAGGDRSHNEEALDLLVMDGYVRVEETPYGNQVRRHYTSERPFDSDNPLGRAEG